MASNKQKDRQIEDQLNRLYTDPSSPGGFAGAEPLWAAVRAHHPEITRKQVDRFLEANRTYTLFRPKRERFRRLRTVPEGYLTGFLTIIQQLFCKFSDVQVDLADFQKLADANAGYRYLLVGVDVLSRRLYGAPTKSKAPEEMQKAFDQLFAQMDRLPGRVYSDQGLEFEAPAMHHYFDSLGVQKLRTSKSRVKAGVAERAIRKLMIN